MFCNKCGTQIADGQNFCPACGEPVASAGQPVYTQQPYDQQPYAGQPYDQQPYYQPQPADMPMAWYKFLIYFSLFAGAVLNVINAIGMFTGSQYTEDGRNLSEYVYAFYDGLQVLDIAYGIVCIALAAFAVYVRFRLAGFCANGPSLLNMTYIAASAANVLYFIVALIIIGETDGINMGSIIGNIVGSVIMVAINTAYFKKRQHMFVN